MTNTHPERGIYVDRTLNLRKIRAIGYDMDYTLIHYRVAEWEGRAFAHAKARLAGKGWPTEDLVFDPDAVIRGLVLDLELGNLLKATRFGYVINAAHGTRQLGYDELRETYAGVQVDLGEDRFDFLNTLFSLSEASLFAQLVDLLDAGELPMGIGYPDVFAAVADAVDHTHDAGQLKEEILADPDRFIVLDPEIVLTLEDQRHAGKELMLITNSEWSYANEVMSYAFDRFLSDDRTWRDLFDVVIVSAAKPAFFTSSNPLYHVVDEDESLLAPHKGKVEPGNAFFGGNARLLEASLGLSGDEILYVGDHIFGDVHFSKALLRWRTALVLRELETEVQSLESFIPDQLKLDELMSEKGRLEAQLSTMRVSEQRKRVGYAEPVVDGSKAEIEALRDRLVALDEEIAPYAVSAGRLRNPTWGPLMRAGFDKSLFARQVERYADVYTSRVSNFLYATPFATLRASRLDLPHDGHVIDGG